MKRARANGPKGDPGLGAPEGGSPSKPLRSARSFACAALAPFALIGAAGCSGPARETAVIHVPDPVAPSASAVAGEEPLALEEPAPAPRARKIAVRDDPANDVPDDRERARTLFQQGAEAYAQGDYLLARDKFQGAYDLVAEPALLFNIATAELRLGNTADACRLFRKYVSTGDPADPRIQDVQRQVAMRCRGIP